MDRHVKRPFDSIQPSCCKHLKTDSLKVKRKMEEEEEKSMKEPKIEELSLVPICNRTEPFQGTEAIPRLIICDEALQYMHELKQKEERQKQAQNQLVIYKPNSYTADTMEFD